MLLIADMAFVSVKFAVFTGLHNINIVISILLSGVTLVISGARLYLENEFLPKCSSLVLVIARTNNNS